MLGIDYTGKTVVVTGGSRGLGRQLVDMFAEAGADVAAWARHPKSDSEVTKKEGRSGRILEIVADVTDEKSVESAVQKTLEAYGRIDVLVNNASVITKYLIDNMPVQTWRDVVETDMTGVFICSQKVLPVMKEQRYGRIINISSIAGQRTHYEAAAHYVAAKAGMQGFTKHLAFEAGAFGITANALCVGSMESGVGNRKHSPEKAALRLRNIPLKRLTKASDIFYIAAFLGTEMGEMITGQSINVDGGQLITWYSYEEYVENYHQVINAQNKKG